MSGTRSLFAAFLMLGCSCGSTTPSPVAPQPEPAAPPPAPTYDVHEWGLVRGAMGDRVMLSGPHVEAVMVVAKPVLYFHLHGEGDLTVDVEARMQHGRIVEHWPSPGGDPGTVASWHGVRLSGASCHGTRYPTLAEDPCRALGGECEASTLATVETSDSTCLHWPQPSDGTPAVQAWNHLFYRGEVTGAPPLPLRAERNADGTLRVTNTGDDPIPGQILRVHLANGAAGEVDGIAIGAPPAPGASVVLGAPSSPVATGGATLGASLREAGLTSDEVDAFRRSWDAELFGTTTTASADVTASIVTATPMAAMIAPVATTSLLYVLPVQAADALATLTFSPAPVGVRRAIVVWIGEDDAAGPPHESE